MSIQRRKCAPWKAGYARSLGLIGLLALMSLFAAAQHTQHATAKPEGHGHGASATREKTAAEGGQVLTVRYHCGSGSSGRAEICERGVNKEEFDALVQAIDPNMAASSRLSLAAEYARVMMMAAEAQRRGVDRSASVQTLLKYSALQVLAAQLVREINARPPLISSEEVEDYFRSHARDYQEVVLSRILVPRNANHGLQTLDQAESLRQRAISGDDFTALQRAASGVAQGAATPNVSLGPLMCVSLPEAHREVCDLNPGEVSRPLADSLGYCIYRLESRRGSDFKEVQGRIRSTLERTALNKEIEKVRKPISLKLDEQYFGKLPASDVAHEHGMHYPSIQPSDSTAPRSGNAHQDH